MSRKDDFLAKCTQQLQSAQCSDVRASTGVVVITLKGKPTQIETAEKQLKSNGLNLDSFPVLAKAKESKKEKASEEKAFPNTMILIGASVFVVMGVLAWFCVPKALRKFKTTKRTPRTSRTWTTPTEGRDIEANDEEGMRTAPTKSRDGEGNVEEGLYSIAVE